MSRALIVALVVGLFGALLGSPASAITKPATIDDASWNARWDPAAGWPPPAGTGWPSVGGNPALAASCGIDLAVLIDRSGSIVGAGQADTYVAAVKDLVDAFAGSPSTMGVWSFGDHGSDFSATEFPWQQMAPLDGPDGPANVADLKATVDSIPFVRNQSTNWEEGLEAVVNGPVAAAGTPDLLLVITDGEPTIHRDDPDTGDTINNDDVAGGIESANAVKASGTRILAVGVGPVTEEGLALISGPTSFNGSNIATADYLDTTFAELRSSLLAFATAICGGSVTVTKEASTPAAPTVFAPAAGWTITGVMDTPPPSGATVSPDQPGTPAADDGVTAADGRVSFGWSSVDSEGITITETPQPGFALTDRSCTLGGQPFAATLVPEGVQLTVGPLQHVECSFRNRARAADGVDLTVTKTDGITTASPGDTVSYTIGYRNDGTAVATGVELQETVPLQPPSTPPRRRPSGTATVPPQAAVTAPRQARRAPQRSATWHRAPRSRRWCSQSPSTTCCQQGSRSSPTRW